MEAKYDRIGKEYDRTRRTDPYLAERMYHLLAPSAGGQYLDIGCGTGNYTDALQKKGLNFTGMDPSAEMLSKAAKRNRDVHWKPGHAAHTGLPGAVIDGVLASLTIHHWSGLQEGFAEMQRILKSGGRLLIFTSSPEQMEGYWLNHYFPEMMQASRRQMPSLQAIEEAMEQSGLYITGRKVYAVQPKLQDLFLYCGKHDPALYLEPAVRNGISSFASLANAAEVRSGLLRMEQDISSGEIGPVMASYNNNNGDYLFLIAHKPL